MTPPRSPFGEVPDRLLTLPQVAEVLQVTRRTVERLIKDGKLESLAIEGVGRRVRAEDLQRLIDRGKQP